MRAVFEAGIGCDRAIVLDGDRLIEAHVETPGLRAGDIRRLRVLEVDGARGVIDADGPCGLAALPPGACEGGLVTVEVVREPVPRPDGMRAAKLRSVAANGAADGPALLRAGVALRARLAARGLPVTDAPHHGPDLLEAAGWSEALEEARTGEVAFPGGRLLIERTAAFDVVDVDGHLPPAELALVAARALGDAVRRFGLAGSIVVDFPTPGDAAARRAVGDSLDAALPRPFERTAMNGFGLVQIIRPRLRPSLIDRMQGDPVQAAALALLRLAERAPGHGATAIVAPPGVHAWLLARPALIAELERRTGRRAELTLDPAMALSGGHAQAR